MPPMPVRQFLNRTDFTNPDTALDLYGNSLRSAFAYDVYEGKTVFDAVVLTKPIFLVDAEIRPSDSTPAFVDTTARAAGRLDKFSFKARLLADDAPSLHAYIPDPCDIQVAEKYSNLSGLYNLHTTFISSDDYTRSNTAVPKIGDIVRVELVKNIFSYNLQFGTFLSVRTNNSGVLPSSTSTETEDGADPTSEWNCATAARLFYESEAFSDLREGMTEPEMRTLARVYLTRLRSELRTETVTVEFEPPSAWLATGPGWDWDLTATQERLGITQEVFEANYGSSPDDATLKYRGPVNKEFFATGTDSTGRTIRTQMCGPWRSANATYPMEKCARCLIGTVTTSFSATNLHSKFCDYIKNAVEASLAAVPTSTINISDNVRSTESQIYLRMSYGCGTTYDEIMNNRSAPCRVPVALPGYSNHEIGLAVDLGGTLTSPSTVAAKKTDPPSAARQSELYRWMRANVHNKASITVDGATKNLGNIKNMDSEPWHWSYNGG